MDDRGPFFLAWPLNPWNKIQRQAWNTEREREIEKKKLTLGIKGGELTQRAENMWEVAVYDCFVLRWAGTVELKKTDSILSCIRSESNALWLNLKGINEKFILVDDMPDMLYF